MGQTSKKKNGFTLLELMIVVGILGIMAASAIPLYGTYRQMAYGAEAMTMARNILNAEIAYYLEHDKFFPENGSKPIFISRDDDPEKDEIKLIKEKLNIPIQVGRYFDYHIYTFPRKANESCMVQIWAPFPIFKGGRKDIIGYVEPNKKEGNWIDFL